MIPSLAKAPREMVVSLPTMPVGWRFDPSEEEIISLLNEQEEPQLDVIPFVEDLLSFHPRQLPVKQEFLTSPDWIWWFFTTSDNNRSSPKGFWKEDSKRPVNESSTQIGGLTTLTYYEYKDGEYTKTEWKMEEYSTSGQAATGSYIVCRLCWIGDSYPPGYFTPQPPNTTVNSHITSPVRVKASKLPIGIHFHPTDVELLNTYLAAKLSDSSTPSIYSIPEIDFVLNLTPDELEGKWPYKPHDDTNWMLFFSTNAWPYDFTQDTQWEISKQEENVWMRRSDGAKTKIGKKLQTRYNGAKTWVINQYTKDDGKDSYVLFCLQPAQ